MDHVIKYTLTRGEEEIELDIEYSLAPFYPGNSYGPPEHCEPPSGGDVEELALSHAYEAGRREEREACAEVADNEKAVWDGDLSIMAFSARKAAEDIAAAIRSREGNE